MELRALEAFVALTETLNFRRAAERLHVTQPALSLRLKRLEDELGFRLLDRTRASVAVSEAGRAFLPHAARVLGEAAAARETARRIGGGEVGRLRIGYTPVSFFGPSPGIVRRFAEWHPDVELDLVELLSDEVEEALLAHAVDVGFLHPPLTARGLALTPLPEERYVVALPSGDPLAATRELRLGDLAGRPLVLTSRAVGPTVFASILALCREAGFEPRIRQEVPTSIAVLDLVAAGHGIGLVVESLSSMTRPGLVFRPIAGPAPSLPTALATREAADAPTITAFVDHLRRALVGQSDPPRQVRDP